MVKNEAYEAPEFSTGTTCAGSSLLLSNNSNTRYLCACFKKSSDVHLFDFSAFLCKRSEEVLEIVSEEESHL